MNVISELFIALNSLEISIALALVFSKKDIYFGFAKKEIDPFRASSILESLFSWTCPSPSTLPLSFFATLKL